MENTNEIMEIEGKRLIEMFEKIRNTRKEYRPSVEHIQNTRNLLSIAFDMQEYVNKLMSDPELGKNKIFLMHKVMETQRYEHLQLKAPGLFKQALDQKLSYGETAELIKLFANANEDPNIVSKNMNMFIEQKMSLMESSIRNAVKTEEEDKSENMNIKIHSSTSPNSLFKDKKEEDIRDKEKQRIMELIQMSEKNVIKSAIQEINDKCSIGKKRFEDIDIDFN